VTGFYNRFCANLQRFFLRVFVNGAGSQVIGAIVVSVLSVEVDA
jgi:hypothetical protein